MTSVSDNNILPGALLAKSFKIPVEPIESILPSDLFQDVLSQLDTPTFASPVMIVVPQLYVDNKGSRVDLCGTIENDVVEYHQGWRYFSSDGRFFDAQGNADLDQSKLVSPLPIASPLINTKPHSFFQWVHPQHCIISSFFTKLSSNRPLVKANHYYLNRMGFVVQLLDGGDEQPFTDKHHNEYTAIGRAKPSAGYSLYDLEYEIRNYPIFSKTDWSTSNPPVFAPTPAVGPESFNPFQGDYEGLLAEFHRALLRCHTLADQLGINFGFNIDKGKIST
jgi:hypothetical protein